MSQTHKRLFFGLRAIGVVLIAIWLVSFFHITRLHFHWRGEAWQLVSRGGVVWIDNDPQRTREVSVSADDAFPTRPLWEVEHDRLRVDTEKAPYGPPYVASRKRILAWEQIHGAHWPLVGASPTSPPKRYHVQLIWILLPALSSVIWLRRLILSREKQVVRWVIQLSTVAVCLAIGVVWVKSSRRPIFLPFLTQGSAYSATVFQGTVVFRAPQHTDPAKLASMTDRVARALNDDVQWTIEPPQLLPLPRSGQKLSSVGISATVRYGSPLREIDESPDQAEATVAMLDALDDPDRYLAAHVALSDMQQQRAFRMTGNYRKGIRVGTTTWFRERVDGLNLQLTPEQRAATVVTAMPVIIVAPGQVDVAQRRCHLALDRQSRPFSLGYATPLALYPIYWAITAWQRRHQRKPNHCHRCGYNLTGNTSGICPECGTGVALTKGAAPGARV